LEVKVPCLYLCISINYKNYTLWEKRVFFQLNFWVIMTIYNSLYFYTHECYQTSCKRCNSLYILDHTLMQLSQQLFFNYYANSPVTTTIMSCSHHFSSIHQNLTHNTMRIFLWFFLKYWYPSSIMILHFRRSCIMTYGTIKSCHVAY